MLLERTQVRVLALAAWFATLAAPRLVHAAGEWDRNGFDSDDLASLDRRHPGLSEQLLHGEAELRTGAAQAAAASFARVAEAAPESALASRRSCQALTELGQRQAAIHACEASLQQKLSAPGFRALVGALMSASPTPEELVLATQLAAAAKRYMSDQPWALAALSDIAERTGDEKMLEATVSELERIAPGHYETLRARKALDSFRLPGWAWAVWLGLALLTLATLVHAARASWAGLRSRRRALAPSALLTLALLATRPLVAAEAAPTEPAEGTLSKWPINDEDPKKSLPSGQDRDRNPLEFGYHMMDLADKADLAQRRGDFRAVGKYYEAMAVAVPDRAIGYRKSCAGYERAGDADRALEMCRGALGAEGVELGDYQHFARLVLAKPGPLMPIDTEDLTQIAEHLKAEAGGLSAGMQIQCDLAERLDDVKRLEDCAKLVAKEAPNDPKLVVYQWGVAMKNEDYARARKLIASARQKNLRPAGIELMERATAEQGALGRRLSRSLTRYAVPISVGLGALSVVGLAMTIRRRLKLHPV